MYTKTLLAFGCSNTRGAEAINDYDDGNFDENINKQYAYPKHVAEMLGYNYVNLAVNGISNQQIASEVINTLCHQDIYDSNNVFVIIGWTDDDRIAIAKTPSKNFRYSKKSEEITTLSHSYVIAHTKSQLCQSLTPLEKKHIQSTRDLSFDFIAGVAERIFLSKNYSDMNFYVKFATACILEEMKIPYITLPTLYYHYNNLYDLFFLTNKQKNNIQHYKINGEINFNYIAKFKEYGVSKSGAHLKADAHLQAGKYLYNYIVENNLLK